MELINQSNQERLYVMFIMTKINEKKIVLNDEKMERTNERKKKEISVKTKVKQDGDSGQSVGRYEQI